MMEKLNLITMRDVETEDVRWLWKPYIPLGKLTIIQGDPGEGKTTMALAIAAAITRGEDVSKGGSDAALAPSSVIFQTAEDGLADTMKPRLEQLNADCSLVFVIDESDAQLTLSDERIEQAILTTNTQLIILDPIQAYMGLADMNSANGIRPLMKSLAAVAERTGCAVVIIGHLNKKSGKSVYRGFGSIDVIASARSVLAVGRLKTEDTARAFAQTKSNLAPIGKPKSFELNPIRGFNWLGDCDVTIEELLDDKPKRENQFEKTCKLITSMLSHGEVSAIDVISAAEDQGISQKTLNRAKSALGVISTKCGGQWYWQIPIEADVVYACEDGQDSQDRQDSVVTALTPSSSPERRCK
jgi:RecA/RadA recombinase